MGIRPRTALGVALALAAASSVLALAGPATARGAGASRVLHVTVTLEPRDPSALAAYARGVATPGSPVYRRYLTPAQFAARFGASPTEIRAVRRSLSARGLSPGPTSAGGLSIPVTAAAVRLEHGLRLPATASAVQSIVGLDSGWAPRPLLVRPPQSPLPGRALRSSLSEAHVATGGPQPCAAAQSTAQARGAHTADEIASAYGFSGLYGAGELGAGTTVAVYELEAVDPRDIHAYEACYGTHTSISYVPVDGGDGQGAGSGEAALDIENLIGMAPNVNVLVYQGPNSVSGAPGAGPYDTFSAIINQDRAQVISVSWGECESALGSADAKAEGALFEQAAAQGQTIVAASGDGGSEDCGTSGTLPHGQLAVDDPSSQPFVTGVGGTTLTSLGPRPSETVWNNVGLASVLQPGASGGGISDLWPMPAAQLTASPALNVLAQGPTGGQCGNPGGYCREVPDVAANADPATGYLIYWNGSGGEPGQPRGWQAIGGTSGAAPVWAALMAIADGSTACEQVPIGYALPALYRAASDSYGDDFNDVQTGNNDFTGMNGGRFPAGPGYDEATGLGSPNAAALAGSLCADSLRLTAPGPQRSATHAAVTLRLRADDARGAAVRFSASGLPAGLSLNPAAGTITGRPRKAGTYHVTLTARDGQGSTAGASFGWTIGRGVRILDGLLSGLSAHRPMLSFVVAAGRGAPALNQLQVTVPADVRLVGVTGVGVSARGPMRPRFTIDLHGGVLTITLRRAFHRVRLLLPYPALQTFSGRHPNVGGRKAPELGLTAIDSSGGTSSLRSRVQRA
jgi:hypothetical protein